MARVRLIVLSGLAMVAACGGGDDPPAGDGAVIDGAIADARTDAADDAAIDARIDASPIDARIDAPGVDAPIDASGPTTCDPLAPPALSGCATGLKCTWVVHQDTPFLLGDLGCVPDGTAVTGESCARGPAGPTTGYDDCAAGLICAGGTCRDVCSFDGAPAGACASGTSCTRYAGTFVYGDGDQFAGACNPNCDPLTQLEADGTDCGVNRGCYVLTNLSETIAVCANAGAVGHNQPITGTLFANSCLPRHTYRRTAPGAATFECASLCRPADVYQGNNVALEGGVAPYTCVAAGAAAPSHPTLGESCQYYWARETFATLSPYSNTLGTCFEHASWTYDTDGDGIFDAPWPRCPTLTTGDVVPPFTTPPHNDAEFFACVQTLPSFAKAFAPVARLPAPVPRVDQLAP